jgi:hypothetical protein
MTETYSAFAPQIRFRDLLEENRAFRDFCKTIPKTPFHRSGKPWRVYVQLEAGGRWARRDFARYSEAFNFAVRLMRDRSPWDLAIHCRNRSTPMPGRWVNLTRDGKPVYLTVGKGKEKQYVLRDGKKVRKQKFVPMHLPPGHEWCRYCRRPTIFRWFSKHHAFDMTDPSTVFHPSYLRCTICGVSENSITWRGGSRG